MKQKSIGIAAVLAATMLTALFTTTPPFSMKDAEGQIILPSCPPGYERNLLGTCVPIVNPDPGSLTVGNDGMHAKVAQMVLDPQLPL